MAPTLEAATALRYDNGERATADLRAQSRMQTFEQGSVEGGPPDVEWSC